MSIESISSIDAINVRAELRAETALDFSSYLGETNNQLNKVDEMVQQYLAGGDMPVHKVMTELSSTKARMQLLVETRNRLLEGFNEVMRMQV
jgi:flagellar hook-basal body complex protein FliE